MEIGKDFSYSVVSILVRQFGIGCFKYFFSLQCYFPTKSATLVTSYDTHGANKGQSLRPSNSNLDRACTIFII